METSTNNEKSLRLLLEEISDRIMQRFDDIEQKLQTISPKSTEVIDELKEVVSITTLSMSDKERMDVIDRCYKTVLGYRNLVQYYTNKNICVSYLRAKRSGDGAAIVQLYDNIYNRYW